MKTYKVIEFDNDEIFADAVEYEIHILPSPEYALELYFFDGEQNGLFYDGYPQGREYHVLCVETGVVTRHIVNTEFEPSFVISDKRDY